MSLEGRKIWMDMDQPKAPVQLQSAFKWFEDEGAELMVTARDFDSTCDILDSMGIDYIKVGKHGGASLLGKLEAYIERLGLLLPLVKDFAPDYFVTFGSIPGVRITFGLRIPSIGFNDEPRSVSVAKLFLPYVDVVYVPNCIPIEEYLALGGTRDRLVPYNGIDENGWLPDFKPDPAMLDSLGVEKGKYVLIRTEMTTAEYLREKMRPEESYIPEFFGGMYEKHPDLVYLIIARSREQEAWLARKLGRFIEKGNVRITRFIPNVANACFYSALVISGGGTIVRESSLLGVPSIEFFPGPTAPQEHFLMDNGFPLWHIRDFRGIVEKADEVLSAGPGKERFTEAFKDKLARFDNPVKMMFERVKRDLAGG